MLIKFHLKDGSFFSRVVLPGPILGVKKRQALHAGNDTGWWEAIIFRRKRSGNMSAWKCMFSRLRPTQTGSKIIAPYAYGFPAPDGHTDATVSHRTVPTSALYACGRTIMHVRRIVPIGA